MDWAQVGTVAFLALSVFLGLRWQQAKCLLKEVAQALTVLSDAIEDNDFTHSEMQAVARELRDVIEAAAKLVRR